MEGTVMANIPVEVWQIIFSFVPFKDQVQCRSVCRLWSDLIPGVPSFKSKNCLDLGFCHLSENGKPLKVLKNSDLKFSAVKTNKMTSMTYWPGMPLFMAQLGETVTYLDISTIDYHENSNVARLFIRNLCVFKVLYHLNIGSMDEFICVVFQTSPHYTSFSKLIWKLVKNHESGSITKESAESFLENETLEGFDEKLSMEKYKGVVLESVTNDLEMLNEDEKDGFDKDYFIESNAEGIVARIQATQTSVDISGCCNTKVRVLSMFQSGDTRNFLDNIFGVFPNVSEFHVLHGHFIGESVFLFLKTHPEKIVKFPVGDYNYTELMQFNLPNLKHLVFEGRDQIDLITEEISSFIEKFPSLNSIRLFAGELPGSHFQYFTELVIKFPEEYEDASLESLKLFTNLKRLQVYIAFDSCYLGHEPFSIPSMQKLKFIDETYGYQCTDCFDNLLRSFPNLSRLSYDTNEDHNHNEVVDKFFNYYPDLETLYIIGSVGLTVTLNPDWPVMKNLKELKMPSVVGGEEDWILFCKKIQKLRYLNIHYSKCPNLPEILMDKSRMPFLQSMSWLGAYELDLSGV